jgi:hypothetical protein
VVDRLPEKPDVMVVEKMRIYPQRKQKGDPNTLIDLAMLGGMIVGAARPLRVLLPTPRDWKGSVPKDIHHKRLRAAWPALPAKLSSDQLDAFGLARYGIEHAY